jgi:hypothetical protein
VSNKQAPRYRAKTNKRVQLSIGERNWAQGLTIWLQQSLTVIARAEHYSGEDISGVGLKAAERR